MNADNVAEGGLEIVMFLAHQFVDLPLFLPDQSLYYIF